MPSRKPFDLSFDWLKQTCFQAILAPAMEKHLRAMRRGCTPKRFNAALSPLKQRVVGDVRVTPFYANAYILCQLDPSVPAEHECVLEIVRYVLMRFGGNQNCVSLYRDGPTSSRNIAHVRFHNPPQGPHGIEAVAELIIEIALLSLRGHHVHPLLDELRRALPSKLYESGMP